MSIPNTSYHSSFTVNSIIEDFFLNQYKIMIEYQIDEKIIRP